MEDYAYIIEYLPSGHAAQLRREPIVQLIGTRTFTLLEATIKPGVSVVLGQKVYVGKDQRNEIERIKGRLKYADLTNTSRDFLPTVLKKLIEERETDFIAFINNSKSISIRVHTLDLLPGIGKKNMEAILEERSKKPFESFGDIKKRIPTLSDPLIVFVHRIINELEGKEKYYLFAKPPFQKFEGYRH